MKYWDWLVGSIVSGLLLLGAWQNWLPISLTEVFGFITGAACVWLTVKQNIWCWPLGIANNGFFIILFVDARLYADMALQVVYIVLGVLGWYWWLHGGSQHDRLPVSKANKTHLVVIGVLIIISTLAITVVLQMINGAAPLLDALTTTLSLAAQYALTRKFIENWYFWITADIIYIGLYAYKGLYLTSALYAIFLSMCIVGLLGWQRELSGKTATNPKFAPKPVEGVKLDV